MGGDISVFGLNKKPFMTFYDTNMVFNSNVRLNESLKFYNNCTINGNGRTLLFDDEGQIRVADGCQLTFYNLELSGLANTNLKCDQNGAKIVFQDCKLTLSSSFIFDTGSILFRGDVVVSGTNKFIYTSSMGSTIDSNSTLYFDKKNTLFFDPIVSNRDLLYMIDKSSYLFFDGATLYSTETGMRLTRGTLFLDNDVTFSCLGSSSSEAICFGDGSADNNLDIKILADAQLNIYGAFKYENTD